MRVLVPFMVSPRRTAVWVSPVLQQQHDLCASFDWAQDERFFCGTHPTTRSWWAP